MSHAVGQSYKTNSEPLPQELMELRERVLAQPARYGRSWSPSSRKLEQARFRSRVLTVARGALQQFKLDLELTRFDLDVTRREREAPACSAIATTTTDAADCEVVSARFSRPDLVHVERSRGATLPCFVGSALRLGFFVQSGW